MLFNKKIKVLLADSHSIFRNGLKSMLSKLHNIEIVGDCKTGQELIDLSILKEPDVVITEIIFPGKNGLSIIQEVLKFNHQIRIIVLTSYIKDEMITQALESGVLGYVEKSIETEEILDCINAVFYGRPFFDQKVAEKLSYIIKNQQYNFKYPLVQFTEREVSVIKFICAELTNKEIAEKLNCSRRTVEGYRIKIMDKLGVKTIAGITAYAYKVGLIDISRDDS